MAKRYAAYAYPVAAFFVMSVFVGLYLRMSSDIGRVAEISIYLGGIALGLVAGGLIDLGSGTAARGLVQVMTGSGNLEPAPSFSYQESLAAKGKYDEAADAYRRHLIDHPEDHHARVALADLCMSHLDEYEAAEQHYLDVRAGSPSPQLERLATESLIDLFRKTGQRGRLMAELARTADRYRGTTAGDAAKRALLDLKESD